MHDVIVIGGGITGAGVARDCAMRGLKTLLIEKNSPGAATTASSTHLIHGGLRYLLYDRQTTHTTCWDSGNIVRIARPLLTRLPIVWPVYQGQSHDIETVETLLESYDHFQALKGGLPHRRLTASETAALFPTLTREGLIGAVSFDEWWVDPVALTEANLDSAKRHGAEVKIGSAVESLIREGSSVKGVKVSGQEFRSKLVINASGPWIDKIASMAGVDIALRLRKGTHLVYEKNLVPAGLLLEAEDRDRYVFVIPTPQGTLVGPTDIPGGSDPDKTATDQSEIDYLLRSARRYFPNFPQKYDRTIVGARPILGQKGNEKLLSREFEVFDHLKRDKVDGFLTIGGGKMSDFRLMAQAVTDFAVKRLARSSRCRTALETLAGQPVNLTPSALPKRPHASTFLKNHPHARQAHALFFLALAYLRHCVRRLWAKQPPSTASEFAAYYGR